MYLLYPDILISFFYLLFISCFLFSIFYFYFLFFIFYILFLIFIFYFLSFIFYFLFFIFYFLFFILYLFFAISLGWFSCSWRRFGTIGFRGQNNKWAGTKYSDRCGKKRWRKRESDEKVIWKKCEINGKRDEKKVR